MKPIRNRLFLASLTLATLAAAALAQPVRPTASDIAGMGRAMDPRLSPDGLMVVYALRTWSFDEDAAATDKESKAGWSRDQQLWIAPSDGSVAPRQITFGDSPVSSPRLAPNGSWLAYLRTEGGATKIHLLRISSGAYGGGEPRILETGDLSPSSIAFTPDSRSIAFLASTPLTDDEKQAKNRSGGAVHFGEEWRNARLYVMPIDADTDAEPRALTDGAEHVTQFVFSPDGARVAIVTSRSADPYYAFSLNTPKIIDARTGKLLATLEDTPAAIGHVAWSPDARLLAYERGDGTLSLLNSLIVHDVRRGSRMNAAASLDPSLAGFVFAEDGSIVAHTLERTHSRFYRLSPDGSRAEPMPAPGRVFGGGFVSDVNRRLIVGIASTPTEPPNPTVLDLRTGRATVVANVHPYTSDWTLAPAETVRWRNADGDTIEGVLWHSPLVADGRPAPLMVLPHGGPDSVTSEAFSSWATYFAARGFDVLRPNYRGGFGYGFDFYAANRGRLGEVEFADIESGVDALIKRGIADPARLVYGGWSWGGFCTAYTVAHTGRYQAAVAGAPVTDTVNQYALSDINHGVAAKWEYTTVPWTNFTPFDNASAVRHITGATTPTLLIQGMADDRVPFGQSITLYRALQDVGCEVKFLAYPREPHGFREPAHTAHMLGAWADWYAQHLTSGR